MDRSRCGKIRSLTHLELFTKPLCHHHHCSIVAIDLLALEDNWDDKVVRPFCHHRTPDQLQVHAALVYHTLL